MFACNPTIEKDIQLVLSADKYSLVRDNLRNNPSFVSGMEGVLKCDE